MLSFPKDLYADVRVEEVTETILAYENGKLRQNKESSTAGAFLRVYDGKRWYYCATTALEQLQEELDALASMAQPNGDILNGYVAVGVDVVLLVSACACEFNDTVVCKSCCDQIFIICVFSVVSKGLAGESSRPLISGLNSVDSGVKFNKYVLVQLVELVSRAQAGNVGELEGDFGLLVVYTEELDRFAAELSCKSSTCGNKACAINRRQLLRDNW